MVKNDNILALASPPGIGAISLIRISGPESISIVDNIFDGIEKIKLSDQHRGIKDMRRLPDLVIIVDAQYEDTAIKEARRLDIPTIAIVDSNTDPNKVTYPIPANDDSMRTINIIISALADAVVEARSGNSDNGNPEETYSINSKELQTISVDNEQEEE